MSIKLSVYSCMAPDYTVDKLAAKAKDIGYDGIEWTVGYKNALWDKSKEWHLSETEIEDESPKLRDICRKYKLEICALGTTVNYREVDRFIRVSKAANILGCKYLRVVMPQYDPTVTYHELYKEAIGNLKIIQKTCKDCGVKALLETHPGSIIPGASSAIRILENFDPDYIGVVYDPGNMICEGYERWQMGIEILERYLTHIHVKNQGWFLKETNGKKKWSCEPTSLKDGMVDYEEIMKGLKKIKYDGWLSLEDFRGGYGCYPVGITTEEKIEEGITYLKGLIS